jgi:tripartite-type tricarboxylate transporter receptor subunit TctC
MSQAAVAGFVVESWYGLMAPAGTPDAAVTTLHREVMVLLAKAEVIKASGARID